MAYIKELLIQCHYQDCTVRASQEAWRDAYSFYGYFCKRHAKSSLKSIEAHEQRESERRALWKHIEEENE